MTGGQPYSDAVLTEDHWQILFTQAFLFATKYINRLRWRGTFGGVLPDGDDAESIAHQAVIDFLHQNPSRLRLLLRLSARHQSTNPSIHQSSIPPSINQLIHKSSTPSSSIHQSESDGPLIQRH